MAKPFNILGLLFLSCTLDFLLKISFNNCLLFYLLRFLVTVIQPLKFPPNVKSTPYVHIYQVFTQFAILEKKLPGTFCPPPVCTFCPCAQSLPSWDLPSPLSWRFSSLSFVGSCSLYPCFLSLDLLFHFGGAHCLVAS